MMPLFSRLSDDGHIQIKLFIFQRSHELGKWLDVSVERVYLQFLKVGKAILFRN